MEEVGLVGVLVLIYIDDVLIVGGVNGACVSRLCTWCRRCVLRVEL